MGSWKLVDLSQDIYQGMPLYGIHQPTFIMTNQTHEESKAATGSDLGFYARNLLLSEHAGTHSDAVLEFLPGGKDIIEMPIEYFYGSAICVDLSHKRYPEYIEIADLQEAIAKSGQELKKGDIFLMYTGLYNREYPGEGYKNYYTGVSYEAAKWLAENGVVNIGVDAPAIDQTPDDLTFAGHKVCGEYGITNTENLANLDKVVNKRFLYIGLPMKIRGGTGSPIRAVALLDE
jgi:kynurenine formamidase